jgi:hypothetical protein
VLTTTSEQWPPAYNGQLEPSFPKSDSKLKTLMLIFQLGFGAIASVSIG